MVVTREIACVVLQLAVILCNRRSKSEEEGT